MVNLIVQQNRVGPIRGRHPWVFSGALKNIPNGIASGTPVTLADEAGNFLAQGYFNSYSQIAVRLWSWNKNEAVDDKFFQKRVRDALELRTEYLADKKTNAYRLINAENDLLPGLIVDRYGDYLCVQFHTQGIETFKEQIVSALRKIIKPKGIWERSDVRDRKRDVTQSTVIPSESLQSRDDEESLSQLANRQRSLSRLSRDRDDNLLYGKVPDCVQILENGYKFWVDVKAGQKTGFFLDQRDKRLALQKYVKGKKVLNCFSYTGGFSVYALGAGAKLVTSVDASMPALELAEENCKLNKIDHKKSEFICGDVKEYLSDLATLHPDLSRGERMPTTSEFDVIILDPPAFVKDRRKILEGLQGYKKINMQAISILPPGGILVTCSCSAHVSLQNFRFILSEAAARANRTLQIIETYTHGIDHPELVAYTEGEYLKCIFARVL